MPPTTATSLAPARPAHRTAAIAGIEPALLEAKCRRPPARPGLVPRPRLVRRLLESQGIPLVLAVAPAGYGKTTLLTRWAGRDPRPFAWVTLDRGDEDPARLVAAIAHALDEVEPLDQDVFDALATPHASLSNVVLPRLGRSVRRPAVLVLDDAHCLDRSGSLEAISTLLRHLRPGSQLALASRTELALPIGGLRSEHRVLELRVRDLAMTRSEAAAMLGMAGLDLVSDQLGTLIERTEGWPAGLCLAALALRDQPDMDRAVREFTGEDRLIADYLRDELFSRVTRDQLEFLTRTSVLDRLSAPLCDFVLERGDSAATLAAMVRSTLVLVPLDRRDECYRYHSLVAGALRTELRRLEPGLEPELHRRAALWFAEHQDPDRAVAHAIAGHDLRLTGDLLWENVPRYLPRGRRPVVERWFAQLTGEQVASVPALALTAAIAHLSSGDGNRLRHWASVAAARLGGAAAGEGPPTLEAGLAVIRAGIGADGMHAMGRDAARAYRLQPEDSPWRSICCLFQGVARQLTGEREPARALLEEGARRGALAAPAIETLCRAQLALLALDEDDLEDAEALVGRALAQAARCGLRDYPTEASVFAVSALVRGLRGGIQDSSRDLRHAQRLLAMLTDFAPWYEAEVRITLARAALRLSDVPAARTLLAEAARFVRRLPEAVVLREWLDAARNQADAASSPAGGVGWRLTTGELRVLQFLPSHLSLPSIAERLQVSPNTVKTHARAVYRKLDASSRAEAVASAREAGLIDPLETP